MGLSNFPSAGHGLLPAVVIVSTISWFDPAKGLLRSCLHVALVLVLVLERRGRLWEPEEGQERVRFTQFKTLCGDLQPTSEGGSFFQYKDLWVVTLNTLVGLSF
ncbi:hypothetical protein SAY87_028850 [Trapa incisa]|uniref:Uncharacterized protein n=1 Tax=Trapa incisa TaxID=236973 RepID=A0AAN7KVH9_9MYRT|nr:hypothetical protein SAY87_028850 [Trapa incisa]